MHPKVELKLVNLTKRERDSRGLEPYLALERKPKSKRRADPERAMDVILVALGAVTAIVIGLLVTAVRAGLQ
jgi:hypothetical protein